MERKEAEELLARSLSGEQADGSKDAEDEAVKRLPPRWEIRVQAQRDPIVEETKLFRSIADEVDGRYDDVNVGKNEKS